MQHLIPWILAAGSTALLAGAALVYMLRGRRQSAQALPTEWAVTARPVFNSPEKRLYRLLREAFPQHVVLSKLPLVRFCQPTDPKRVRYWYGLLGSSHVTFAICSNNGRVLAVIDLTSERGPSTRSAAIKQAVLNACQVRYLSCSAARLPTVPEVHELVPGSHNTAAGLSAVLDANAMRRDRQLLWQDSGFLQDSFFGMDGRSDAALGTGFAPSTSGALGSREGPPPPDEIGGVVIDTPVSPLRH